MKNRRFNVVIPAGLADEVENAALEEGCSVSELLRRCIRVGVGVRKVIKKHIDTEITVKQDNKEFQLLFTEFIS